MGSRDRCDCRIVDTHRIGYQCAANGYVINATEMGGGKGGGILENILTKTKGAPAALGRGALAAGAALGTGTVAASTVMVVGAGAVGYGLGSGLNALGGYAAKGTRMEDFATDVIGKMAAQIMASLGSKNAEEALVINLHLDGQQITQVVNARNNSTARRN